MEVNELTDASEFVGNIESTRVRTTMAFITSDGVDTSSQGANVWNVSTFVNVLTDT